MAFLWWLSTAKNKLISVGKSYFWRFFATKNWLDSCSVQHDAPTKELLLWMSSSLEVVSLDIANLGWKLYLWAPIYLVYSPFSTCDKPILCNKLYIVHIYYNYINQINWINSLRMQAIQLSSLIIVIPPLNNTKL
jgi:hypothetical protein